MFPYRTIISLDRKSRQPLYLQLANQLIKLIKESKLPPRTKLLGSRQLAVLLKVHRKTIVACYEELTLQGWVESLPKKGTYVHANLPLLNQQDFSGVIPNVERTNTGFTYYKNGYLKRNKSVANSAKMHLNDGISDLRLTPVNDLARIYRSIASKRNALDNLSYGSTYGVLPLREVLTEYLNKTRGLNSTKATILITRGSQMAIYLASQLLLKKGDVVIVGNTNYSAADSTFEHYQAKLVRVPVDADGLDTNAIEALCKKQAIKAIYVTSHHHHPTTVTLSAKRRIHLLNLAKAYNFAIIEDDYDYDFNYNHAPILPLASHDTNGNVIYIGSVCKTVAPVYRIGYLIAPKAFIDEAANLRRIIDRQGDALLELTFAAFIKNGDLDRHIKKVMRIYKERRDLFCKLLQDELGAYFQFEIPKGGMAVWVILDKKYSWDRVDEIAKRNGLDIGDWRRYDLMKSDHNGIRMGFASYTTDEIYALITVLKKVIHAL